MIIFYEAFEVMTPEQEASDYVADLCRIDVTALNEVDRESVLSCLKDIIPLGVRQKHECHNDNNDGACVITEL